jgi:hypothetical protein
MLSMLDVILKTEIKKSKILAERIHELGREYGLEKLNGWSVELEKFALNFDKDNLVMELMKFPEFI